MAAELSHPTHKEGNTVYVVTGSNSGIGLALVHALLRRPESTIVALHRPSSEQPGRPRDASESSALLCMHYTATQPSSDIAWLAGRLRTEHNIPTIDVVVASAGAAPYALKPVLDTPWDEVAETADINFGGPLRLIQGLKGPLGLEDASGQPTTTFAKERKFVFVSSSVGSLASSEPLPGLAYGASKAAANFMVTKLNFECKDIGLCALALHPGWVKTRMGAAAATSWGMPETAPPMTVEQSAEALLKIIDDATIETAGGKFLSYDGTEIPW